MTLQDNPQLLERLMLDMTRAEDAYKPANYWQVYQKRLMPALNAEGISRFRSSQNPVFTSFGVTQIPHLLVEEFALSLWKPERVMRRVVFEVLRRSGLFRRYYSKHIEEHRNTVTAFQNAIFHFVLQGDPKREILRIADSGFGHPRDLFAPVGYSGNQYTLAFLRYFSQYLWVRRFVDFSKLSIVVELGSGYGGQAEVLCKLYPHLRYIVCDIPPQLYVTEQYLKAVFPEEVTGYTPMSDADILDLSGTKRITVLASWQLTNIRGQGDLFWSSATFQEMEPDIVSNYARILQPIIARYIYLLQMPEGQHVAIRAGEPGVLERTRLRHYVSSFDRFHLIQQEDCILFGTTPHGSVYVDPTKYDHLLFERFSEQRLKPGENSGNLSKSLSS